MRNDSVDQVHRDPLPESFDTLSEVGEFWDTHSSADYEDEMEDIDVEVDLSSTQVYCAIDRELARRLRERAHQEGVSTEDLIQRWLRERVAAA